ncbi:hypothetical protein C8A03DRAFT_18773 [Achaetomium macrosporum]|uniref:Uncharacterized protein n=1 Tax=Achaetomium macrosporum TaxID=79813 RepID=A0AAN7C2V2_9PEZI|nr:hypothetical protein C8A03DRAFT_18773 [Achaetomium macrosporum]
MGTRHLVCVFWKGRWVLAQYGGSDGFPEGRGIRILKFLSVAHNIEKLKAGLDHVYYPTEEELDAIWDECQAWDANWRAQHFYSEYGMKGVNQLYPSLASDASARILGMIARAAQTQEEDGAEDGAEKDPKKIPVQLQLEFANESLFCEWAYVVELDKEVFEVYYGNERKHDGHRFKDVGEPDEPVPAFVCSLKFSETYLIKSPQEFFDRVSEALFERAQDNAKADEETEIQDEGYRA